MKRRVRGKRIAVTVCLTQGLVSLVVASIAAVEGGATHAKAAIYGGLVAIIPAGYMALRVFTVPADAAPGQLAVTFYRGELGKLVLTALLFWIGVVLFAGEFLSLMSAYIASLSAYWVAMAVMRSE